MKSQFFFLYKDCFAFPLQRKEALNKSKLFYLLECLPVLLGQHRLLLLWLGIRSHMVPTAILLILGRKQSPVGAWQGGNLSRSVRNHVLSPEPRCVICCWLCLLPGSHNSACLLKILMFSNIVTIEVFWLCGPSSAVVPVTGSYSELWIYLYLSLQIVDGADSRWKLKTGK